MEESIKDEFEGTDLKDLRRGRRLSALASSLAAAPANSITAASGGWAECMAAFRFLNNGDYEAGELIAPHIRKTVGRCARHPCVIAIQDTSEMDFSHMKAAEGLGPLNDEKRRGFFLHNHYVVSEQGLPLGVLGADIMLRDDADFRGGAERRKLPIGEKESRRWIEGYRKAHGLARELPDTEVFSVSDREGDIFELYEEWMRAEGGPRAEWIVRSKQNRVLINVEKGAPNKLFEAVRQAPVLGEFEFDVPSATGNRKVKGIRTKTTRTARTVRQRVRVMEVTPRPPERKGRKLPQVTFRAVWAAEVDPPAGEEPINWLLLTSRKITTLGEARRIIGIYLRRWDIEVYFRALKTGCRVERIQLKSGEALVRALMIYLVIAWRILYLTHLGRRCPELACGCVFDEAEWRAACAVAGRPEADGEPSLSEFVGIIGRLGGHLGRKSDGVPGAEAVWRGLSRVRDFALVWRAMRSE